jgi:KaiC/GvpD/RAD55 family RecA-like ATPase/class 3 adenylate cyclase
MLSGSSQIPGLSHLTNKGSLSNSKDTILLLKGAPSSGKTVYCRSFIADGLHEGVKCVYLNSSLTDKQFRNLFSNCNDVTADNLKFVNPYLKKSLSEGSSISSQFDSPMDPKLALSLQELRDTLSEWGSGSDTTKENKKEDLPKIFFVIDSLTHLLAIFKEDDVLRFVNALSFALREVEATAIFTLTTASTTFSPSSSPSSLESSSLDEIVSTRLSSLFDGVLEIRMEEIDGKVQRKMKLSSSGGMSPKSTWTIFEIDGEGMIKFVTDKQSLICSLCKAPILDEPKFYSDLAFHTKHLDIYMKLAGAYGKSRIADVGPSVVVNANFFFVDIVGLSDPSLSVRRQIEKIEVLNNFISSCSAFKKTSEKKILPTGDGMAVGFMQSPEMPLQLSMELHKKLREYNQRASKDDASEMGVRIGLASGPVFIVNDVNNNQNIWGPGIILARRVMDVGDGGHILIEGGLAESLTALEDKYRSMIKYLGNYQIKHGQVIKMYSAYSDDFGNPARPAKLN